MRVFAPALLLAIACRDAPIPAAARFPAGTPFRAQERVVDGTRLRLIDTGQGPPVILVHGFGASLYSWRHLLGPIAAAGYRVIAFDNRGFGFSGKPAQGYDNAAYEHLLVALMDSLRVADAVLVGHSMGGAVVLETAVRDPQRVRGLVLLGAAGLGLRSPTGLKVLRWPVVGPVLAAARGRRATAAILRSTYGDAGRVTAADVDQYYAPIADAGYPRAIRAVLRHFRFDALTGRLGAVAAPALVIWGERDHWIPVALGKQMASELPRAAFVVIAGAGHAVNEEAADSVLPLMRSFLKEGLPRVPENLAWSPPPSSP